MIAFGIKYTKAIVSNNIPRITHLLFSNKLILALDFARLNVTNIYTTKKEAVS
jgi:hypothetical protein